MKIKRILFISVVFLGVFAFKLKAQPGAETAALAKIEATLQESKLLQYMNLSVNQGVMKTAKDAVNYGVNTVKAIQLSNEILEMTNSLICQQDELYTLVSIPGVADDCLTGIKLNSMIADLTFSNGVMKKIILSSNLMQMDIKADGIVAMLEKVKSTLQKTIKDVEDLNRELTVEFWVNYVRDYQVDEIDYASQKQAAYSQSLDRLMQAEEKRRVSLGLTELRSIPEGSRSTQPQIVSGGQED
ncbi:MAG TPA: hypothetical protein PKW61_10850, partial [Tenuifilaceae bacterium]|nr:hypothetical protein [Tenuifilaceae bacterium]